MIEVKYKIIAFAFVLFSAPVFSEENNNLSQFAILKKNIIHLIVYKNVDKKLLAESVTIVNEILKVDPYDIKAYFYKASFDCVEARDNVNLVQAKGCISNLQKLEIKNTDKSYLDVTLMKSIILATFPKMFTTYDEAIEGFEVVISLPEFKKLQKDELAIAYAYYAVAIMNENEDSPDIEKNWQYSYSLDKDVAKKLRELTK